MRLKSMRVLAALIGAGVVAGFANAPVTPVAAAASPANVTESRVSPAGAGSHRRTALSVRVRCSSSGACGATATGGTGVYESWEWYGADEYFDGGGAWSDADASGYCVSGAAVQVAARVTDSSGASALGDTFIFCPN